ncbi:hypothetical protein FB451DRAFT_1342615 [Mycena latifolia]|nr:hypothetical protein FB451DRAFT_1342615 [Mycena latifolia]
MDSATRARLASMMTSGEGRTKTAPRPLSELVKTKETLKGAESQRLRTFCTSNTMQPGRDMDTYAHLLNAGNVEQARAEFARRVARHRAKTASTEAAERAAAQEISALTWGPTRLTIFHVLLHFRVLFPAHWAGYLEIAHFLATEARVPVDGADLSGTLALSVAIGTKPIVDFEYAQLLFDAGGDTPNDKSIVARAAGALEWFLAHGGNVDIADGDGMRPRYMASRLVRFAPSLEDLIAEVDRKRNARAISVDSCCGLCGREDGKLLKCSKCKAVRYCEPSARACQKLDWPHHKKNCVQAPPARDDPPGGFSFLGTKFHPA